MTKSVYKAKLERKKSTSNIFTILYFSAKICESLPNKMNRNRTEIIFLLIQKDSRKNKLKYKLITIFYDIFQV